MGRIPDAADPAGGLERAMAEGRVIGLARLEDGMLNPEHVLQACLPPRVAVVPPSAWFGRDRAR